MNTLRQALRYPRPFWTLLAGHFINRASAALVWPFLTLIMRERLDAPLTTITALISVQALAGALSTSIIGAVMDRYGRKRAMIAGLILSSGVLYMMSVADALWQWSLLAALHGAFNPVFYVGSSAMVADLVPPEERTNAYALMRMVANLGIAVGPALGGFLLVTSQSLPFIVTGTVNLALAGFTIVYVGETLVRRRAADANEAPARGYKVMLADQRYLRFWSAFTLLEVAASLIFVLLPVYSKENFGLLESQFGWLLTINALMVVTMQMALTRWSSRFQPLLVIGVGALFYTAGMIGIALSSEFVGFALSMVVITIGELLVAPTGTAMVANLAPPDMRARYMGIFSLTYTVGSGVGPVMGGFLNDNLAPAAIWYGGALCATISAGWFIWMWRQRKSWTRSELEPIAAEPLVQEV